MATLVRQFVCGGCGGTSAHPGCPFQRCTSCGAVSDYDFGVARTLPDWPRHEGQLAAGFTRHQGALAAARNRGDKRDYATAYAEILRPLMQAFPALYPPAAAADPAYLDQLLAFYGAWQAHTAIDAECVRLDGEYRARRDAVEFASALAVPATLWPLIDTALATAALQARLCAEDPGPPSDFLPAFVRRFTVAITVAEWLPQLDAASQRALVLRCGVSAEYLAPSAHTVTCGNCGGAVPVSPGFLAIACPFCSAEIEEARPDYRPTEVDRSALAFTEQELTLAVQRGKQELTQLALLDGPVTRERRALRLMTLRACFARGSQDACTILEAPDSPLFAALEAWLDAYTADHAITCRMLRYREHPRCLDAFHDTAELARRLADVAPDGTPTVAHAGMTAQAEVIADDGAVVRLAIAEGAHGAELIDQWLRQARRKSGR